MTDNVIASFIGVVFGYVFIELAWQVKDRLDYYLELRAHKKYCEENNLPYIKPSDANKALESFMNRPLEEFVQALEEAEEGRASLRICPKCLEYKRNFMIEGKERECMDCAIGGISDN